MMEPNDPGLPKATSGHNGDTEGELPVYFETTASSKPATELKVQDDINSPDGKCAKSKVKRGPETDHSIDLTPRPGIIQMHHVKHEPDRHFTHTGISSPPTPMVKQETATNAAKSTQPHSIKREPVQFAEGNPNDTADLLNPVAQVTIKHVGVLPVPVALSKSPFCKNESANDFPADSHTDPQSSTDLSSPLLDHSYSDVGVGNHQMEAKTTPQKVKLKVILKGRKHVCDVCDKAFCSASYLRSHKSMHKGEESHVCDLCNKAFSSASYLKSHKSMHLGQENHVCDVCSKSFTVASSLKTHKLLHKGEKNHTCEVCKKAFSREAHLKQHMLIHLGDKNHVCEVCKKSFTQASNLKKHKLIHTAEKKHVCDVCDKAFHRNADLKRHSLIHYKEKKFDHDYSRVT